MRKLLTLALAAACAGAAAAAPPPPAGFTRFEFAGHEAESSQLNAYLWHHFHHRLGNSLTLFNKEYLLKADMWLNNAQPRNSGETIQAIHRNTLLEIEQDAAGYVNTHQHFSHAHDQAWPFPLWTQSDHRPTGIKGKTYGWHFQPLEAVPGWVGDYLRAHGLNEYAGEAAIAKWRIENAVSEGMRDNAWIVRADGPGPILYTPEDYAIEARQAPFVQLRWSRSDAPPDARPPYLEWRREDNPGFSPERRAYFYPEKTLLSRGRFHSMARLYDHPEWTGRIAQIRICPAPGESDVELAIDSFFTVYDTRHTINNPIFILANEHYLNWTGDLALLRENIGRMRLALLHHQTVLGGREHNFIRNPWPNHCGRPGWARDPETGELEVFGGRGMGSNYWDLLPFGGDDFYATAQYYAATLAMARIEEQILANPGWNIPRGALAFDPEALRAHARDVKRTADARFWNPETDRFAGVIDRDGAMHDYGFTFLNLDAIWYGIASPERGKTIMDWIAGERIVPGDTATGEDIYAWRFGPRATTRRNVEWYAFVWTDPASIPWGGQIQDGGAVLGFTFYDLWARLRLMGPDNAWERLREILAWDREVQEAGGYRAYYEGGARGTTLQGGGTAGGIGIDFEFFESSLLPAIVVYGFLGLRPSPSALEIDPSLPEACPEIAVRDLKYQGTPLDLACAPDRIAITLHSQPARPIPVRVPDGWRPSEPRTAGPNGAWLLEAPGVHVFTPAPQP